MTPQECAIEMSRIIAKYGFAPIELGEPADDWYPRMLEALRWFDKTIQEQKADK